MQFRERGYRLSVHTVCGTLFAFAFILVATTCVNADNKSDLSNRLKQLMGQYASIQTVNLIARAHIISYPDPNVPATGSAPNIYNVYFEYTADHEKYNIVCKSDFQPQTEYTNVRYTYNGKQFEFLSYTGHDLFYQKADDDSLVLLTLNPFYCPICFLDLSNDKIYPALKLLYVQNPSTFQSLLSNIKPDTASSGEIAAILPKIGTLLGKPFGYRIVLGGKISYLPTRIDQILLDNVHNPAIVEPPFIVERIEILDYGVNQIAEKPFYWAKTIKLSIYYPNGQLSAVEDIDVLSCDTNQPVNQNDFTIDFKLAQRIEDRDTGTFVQVHTDAAPPQVRQ